MPKEPSADAVYTSLMERLVKAGIAKRYDPLPRKDQPIMIEWHEDFQTRGGEAAFFALARLLKAVCQDSPLSTDEQAMIQLVLQDLERD